MFQFRRHAEAVPRTDVVRVEYLLRGGRRKLQGRAESRKARRFIKKHRWIFLILVATFFPINIFAAAIIFVALRVKIFTLRLNNKLEYVWSFWQNNNFSSFLRTVVFSMLMEKCQWKGHKQETSTSAVRASSFAKILPSPPDDGGPTRHRHGLVRGVNSGGQGEEEEVVWYYCQ